MTAAVAALMPTPLGQPLHLDLVGIALPPPSPRPPRHAWIVASACAGLNGPKGSIPAALGGAVTPPWLGVAIGGRLNVTRRPDGARAVTMSAARVAVHQQQQAETRRLLEKARKQDNVRLIEMLERDDQSLTRILDGLDQIEADAGDRVGHELDLRDLAQSEEEGA
jgi:hypothetical protein